MNSRGPARHLDIESLGVVVVADALAGITDMVSNSSLSSLYFIYLFVHFLAHMYGIHAHCIPPHFAGCENWFRYFEFSNRRVRRDFSLSLSLSSLFFGSSSLFYLRTASYMGIGEKRRVGRER